MATIDQRTGERVFHAEVIESVSVFVPPGRYFEVVGPTPLDDDDGNPQPSLDFVRVVAVAAVVSRQFSKRLPPDATGVSRPTPASASGYAKAGWRESSTGNEMIDFRPVTFSEQYKNFIVDEDIAEPGPRDHVLLPADWPPAHDATRFAEYVRTHHPDVTFANVFVFSGGTQKTLASLLPKGWGEKGTVGADDDVIV